MTTEALKPEHSANSEPAGWSREAIARIIDPAACDAGYDPDRGDVQNVIDRRAAAALALADRIMALAPPLSLDGEAVERVARAMFDNAQKRRFRADDNEPAERWGDQVWSRKMHWLSDARIAIAALAAAPLPVGEQGNQGVMADSGPPTLRRGSHTTDQRSTS